MKIMIIDDSQTIHDAIALSLSDIDDLQIKSEMMFPEMIDDIVTFEPGVIFMDDGLINDTTKNLVIKLKSHDRLKESFFVLLSNRTVVANPNPFLNEITSYVVRKPFRSVDVLSILNRTVFKDKPRRLAYVDFGRDDDNAVTRKTTVQTSHRLKEEELPHWEDSELRKTSESELDHKLTKLIENMMNDHDSLEAKFLEIAEKVIQAKIDALLKNS
jgi:hypothetical protein